MNDYIPLNQEKMSFILFEKWYKHITNLQKTIEFHNPFCSKRKYLFFVWWAGIWKIYTKFFRMVIFLKFKKDSNECSLKKIWWMTWIHIINFVLITRIFGKKSKFFRKCLNTFESSLSSNVLLVMTYKKT